MYSVTLKNNKQFECNEDTTILDAALQAGIVLAHSCKQARCNSCKVRVLKGTTDNKVNEAILTEDEKAKGFVLSCNAKPLTNLNLDIEDLSDYKLRESKIIPAKIDTIEKYRNLINKITLRLPPNSNFDFLAGQHVNIIKGPLKRSYSIANYNKQDNKLEFFIKAFPNGLMSHYWFKEAKENDLLRIEGPLGTFFLRDNNTETIIFLATGTGIAPIKSILERMELEVNKYIKKQIYLFWGNRYPSDFFEIPEFSALNINYIPVISRPDKYSKFKMGYVQNIAINELENFDKTEVYACGSNKMINDAKAIFIENGLKGNWFYSDAFVSSN